MSKKIEERVVAHWVEVGAWCKGPAAPNGSVPGRIERRMVERVAYFADFYGKGEKIYLDSVELLQGQDSGYIHRYGRSSDGHPERIAAVMERAGVVIG